MATIIEVENGFIAGDPDTVLAPSNHWCVWCAGDGLEYDDEGGLTICGGCSGVGQVRCDVPDCKTEHPPE